MCKSCEALCINGVYCHETGCPDSHLDHEGNPYPVNCKECGTEFVPDERGVRFCSDSCYRAYHGFDSEEDEEVN